MGENIAKVCALGCHAGCAKLAHAHTVANAVALQPPARAVLGGRKIDHRNANLFIF